MVSVFLCHGSLSILLSHVHHQISPDPRFNHCGTTGVITRPQFFTFQQPQASSSDHRIHVSLSARMFYFQTTHFSNNIFPCQTTDFIIRSRILLSDMLYGQITHFTVRPQISLPGHTFHCQTTKFYVRLHCRPRVSLLDHRTDY